jgi:hypothetical protein
VPARRQPQLRDTLDGAALSLPEAFLRRF